MKEFHFIFDKATNKKQFAQICDDSFYEINNENCNYLDSMIFFNDYYNLNFTLLELARLGKFIQSGEYKKQLEIYV